MKKRVGFVSNSSSSSFILYNWCTFKYFNFTKQDFVDALIDLMGKDYVEKYQKDTIDYVKRNPKWYKDDKYAYKPGPFYVYDMYDPEDKKEAYDRWGSHLSEWTCYQTAIINGELRPQVNINSYYSLINQLSDLYDVYPSEIFNDGNPKMFVRTEEKQEDGSYGYYKPVPKYVVKMFKDIRKRCYVVNNLDILKHKGSRFFIHFDENEIYRIKGMCVPSKYDKKFDENDEKHAESNKKHNEEIANSIYKSKSYSRERLSEVLFLYFVKIGKIKIRDKKFLDTYYKVDPSEQDVKDPKIKYSTVNGKTLTYLDWNEEYLTFDIHEG